MAEAASMGLSMTQSSSTPGRVVAGVALVSTVYNEASNIREFLESILSLQELPEEFIVVDGGSTDGTTEAIEEYLDQFDGRRVRAQLIIDPACNRGSSPGPIAKGRNVAIRAARCPLIAITDAGCLVHPEWLGRIVGPLASDCSVDAVGGWYSADARSFTERCIARVWVKTKEMINPQTVLPSSRSFAVRKSAWEKVGGYPETSYWAEDTNFVLRLRALGCTIAFVPEATVYWRMRPSLRSFALLVFHYGTGDGFNHLLGGNVLRNLLKVSVTILTVVLALTYSPFFLLLLAAYWWWLPFIKRPIEALKIQNVFLSPILGWIKFLSDTSYILGYVSGFLSSLGTRPRVE